VPGEGGIRNSSGSFIKRGYKELRVKP